MPAFKDILKTEEIWKIVAFMRGGFPSSLNPNEKGAESKTAPR
jgi:mono/diheme cytochrome c family protein